MDISNAATGLKWSMCFFNEPRISHLTGKKGSLADQFSPARQWLTHSVHISLKSPAPPALSHWKSLSQVLSRYCSLNLLHLPRPQSLGTWLYIRQVGSMGLIKFALKKALLYSTDIMFLKFVDWVQALSFQLPIWWQRQVSNTSFQGC